MSFSARPLPGRTDYGGAELARTNDPSVSFPGIFASIIPRKSKVPGVSMCATHTRSEASGSMCGTHTHLVLVKFGLLTFVFKTQIIQNGVEKTNNFFP